VEAIVGLLTNERTTVQGRFVQLTDAMCNPKPIQQPHPPIVIGGSGERRTLRSVARYAQHWNFPGGTPEFFLQKRAVLARHCDAIGRDVDEIITSTHLRFGEDGDVAALVEQTEQMDDAGLTYGIITLSPRHGPDVLEPIAKALDHLRDA
jgi:alkanesulfonate monooxygenase SsuD/methylene tetrahydromethanopterin reductase-like flavin-dependent oxidoreductase (luciferase family)